MSDGLILRVAIDAPVMQSFDYLVPDGDAPLQAGQRVLVPFRKGKRVGVVVELAGGSDVPAARLRRALAILDPEPLIDGPLMALLDWAAGYYQHPPGEVFATALPRLLRAGRDTGKPRRRTKRKPIDEAEQSPPLPAEHPPVPTPPQAAAIEAISAAQGYHPFLLQGVTGSGKTEVYLRCIDAQLVAGRQSLVLVPEIGLTPQLVDRFRRRFPAAGIALLHSGLTDTQRLDAWGGARDGRAGIIIGTRSAVFAPLPRPGLIVVDEEHDSSLKQQDGFRYSARDIAVWRAHQLGVPIVLGSATPSLESLANAGAGRYRHLYLPERAGTAKPPSVHLVDLRGHLATDGLAPPLVNAIRRHLEAEGQVLLYLNRRGYAPTLMCPACGLCLECKRCDARLVLHRRDQRVTCHHCGSSRAVPAECADCGGALFAVGQGTERIETAIGELFPGHPLIRIDRDTTRGRGEIERRLGEVAAGRARILLGTQMLTKGHDFPGVTMVGIIDADQGLFGTDFRASEKLAQTFVQVAGRAGRGERPGEVWIQTLFPDHPLLQVLIREGYGRFAEAALAERRAAGWPPFSYLAMLRAEAPGREPALRFLGSARAAGEKLGIANVRLLGPAPAPMEKRAGRYRSQLLVEAGTRPALQRFLAAWRPQIGELPEAGKTRWSLDVDPVELF